MTRSRWGLGFGPIPNMIHLLEAHGVRVFAVAPDCRDIDAFSFVRDETPYVFLNTEKTGERQRFDAAHELGHLVLHGSGNTSTEGRDKELEANHFAAAFLMPQNGILQERLRNATLNRIVETKTRWKVSAMALTHRLHELGLITDWVYRSSCVTLSQAGYRKSEPAGMVPEGSQVLKKVLFGANRIPINDVAHQLGVTKSEVRSHISELVPSLVA